jgi:hypothetical protein
MRWLPLRNAKWEWTTSLFIECNASGDAEQIRETVNTGRLHARVKHNPNFVDRACSIALSLVAKTLTFAAIVKCHGCKHLTKKSGIATPGSIEG